MKILGFNFTKINAERNPKFKFITINTNIEFTDFKKDSSDLLKDSDLVKISFKFEILYLESQEKTDFSNGKLLFEGVILVSLDKKDPDLIKLWQKKELTEEIKVSLMNIIIKKCSAKALALEEELDMPPHFPLPRIPLKKQEAKDKK